ncbi:hypothetical protein Pint_10162 [Pistacia integerrima]|uniref:Uncharacterized protein n=1 Tax=Pistacia integerrima TaxID=434235 RepID=A0ACC0XJ55_9ROSI|nr:hypothetical protein Pint_10162 [Pistacia integerrima]
MCREFEPCGQTLQQEAEVTC